MSRFRSTSDHPGRGTDAATPGTAMWLRTAPEWKQAGFGQARWELRTERDCAATVERHGFLVTRWVIAGPSGRWDLKRDWRGRRWIGRPDDSEAAVRYQPAWRGGRLRLRDATQLLWKRTRLGRREWAITTPEGHPFLTIRIHGRPLRLDGTIEFDVSARRLAALEPLVLLAWVLIVDARAHAH